MKGVDLSNYALEDLLAFDDIFLDYFNSFLKNQAFPQQIQYNRYLGIFEEIDASSNSIVVTDRLPRHLIINNSKSTASNHETNETDRSDPQNNSVFDWVRIERLPLFFRTDFFREFKLCKLLTRPLEEERSDSATSSQLIGGYSRQSPPISNSLSTDDPDQGSHNPVLFASPSNKDSNKITNLDEILNTFYSNSVEMDSSFQIDLPYLDRFNRALFQRPGSRALSVPSYFPFATMNRYSSSNLVMKSKKRTATSKSDKSEIKNDSEEPVLKKAENIIDLTKIQNENNDAVLNNDEVDGDGEEVYYDDEFDGENGDNTKNFDLKLDDNISFVGDFPENEEFIENVTLHASINQYKLKFLGSVNGMREFRDFLKKTSGFRLYKFWLDCEFYRDSMQDYDQIDNMATRNRLFRDINEKYVFAFAKKMHEKVSKNYFAGQGLNHSLFDRIQYDILRRLRSYWVPRFVLNKLKLKGKDFGNFPLPPLTPDYSRQSTYLTAPPSRKGFNIPIMRNNTNHQLNENQKRDSTEWINLSSDTFSNNILPWSFTCSKNERSNPFMNVHERSCSSEFI
ncbi:unnamed protein product [Brachionus calyciflorus]|uniref:RGS domain-containing protein n=1 Tax=Brachionus calyciflorus TaxID=104777 RepID=A0A813VLU2_9BILA|nr:unnamed protein product [Brachionus calyciflorus]